VIGECEGNLSRAARVLQIDRTTLYHKLKRYRANGDSGAA
jgi:transcriptional regulator of acetoin/glycerol metabolism